jgi:hypothetical protein
VSAGQASASAADQLRQDIGRISASRPDGMPTAPLAAALAAEGWVKLEPAADRGVGMHPDAAAANAIAAVVTDRFRGVLGYVPFIARYGVAHDVLHWLDENRPGWGTDPGRVPDDVEGR